MSNKDLFLHLRNVSHKSLYWPQFLNFWLKSIAFFQINSVSYQIYIVICIAYTYKIVLLIYVFIIYHHWYHLIRSAINFSSWGFFSFIFNQPVWSITRIHVIDIKHQWKMCIWPSIFNIKVWSPGFLSRF